MNFRFSSMVKVASILVVLFCVLGLVGDILAVISTREVQSAQREASSRSAGVNLLTSANSDLTNLSRAYVVGGLSADLADYTNQLYIKRDREYGVRLLNENGGTKEQLDLLKEALEASKIRDDIELHAIALAALARGEDMAAMPATVENYSIPAEEEALPAEQQLALASELVFGRDYSLASASVIEPVRKIGHLEAGSLEAAGSAMQRANVGQTISLFALMVVFFLLGAVVLTFLILLARRVRRPLSRHTVALQNHDQYDLGFRLRDDTGVPEIRDLARAFNGQNDQVNELIGEVSGTSVGLQEHAGNLADTAAQLDETAQDTRARAAGAAEQAQLLATNMDTLSAAMEEMQAAIRQISESATSASQISEEAVESVGSATKVIDTLGESSQSIGEITNSITSIAEQTNLLALNATIEAARAGDAGKGFAVVAGEVKDLAAQTAVATADISERVSSIQEDSTKAAEAITQISEIISRINDSQQTIASAVEEQTATTNEMFGVVRGAAQTTQDIVGSIETVSSTAERSAEGARTTLEAGQAVADSSSQLSKLVSRYHQ